jgi:hypothetical protein
MNGQNLLGTLILAAVTACSTATIGIVYAGEKLASRD